MKITIEGKEIEARAGQSVLDAALDGDVYIPHLCKHPDLEAAGGCRLCCVEIEGVENVVPACKTEVWEGMKVSVNSPGADKTRKMAMELILATHPSDCTGCPKYGKCELQSMYQYLGVGPERWRKKARTVATDRSNPLIEHLFTRCVRCGRCIRACRELRGVKVLDYQRTKDGIRVGIDGDKSLKEAGCRFCGACIEVCPTGSIMDALNMRKEGVSRSDAIVPCRGACPAGIDIPRYIRYIKNGRYQEAVAVIREKVPFPQVLGSVCSHVCESNCKRNELGDPVSICRLKRAAGAEDDGSWRKAVKKEPPTGKKAAVIGAGPAGLTAAYYLTKKGHEVTVFEANEKAGGQLRYGIPSYRLPDELVDQEIQVILDAGVHLLTGTRVESPKDLLNQGYEVVLTAIGTHKGTKLPIPGNDLSGVTVNAEFLKEARTNTSMNAAKRIIVLGGGNVAYDCARTAVRLGAKEVHIVCLESLEQMTASKEEIQEGKEEGIMLHDGWSFQEIMGEECVQGVKVKKVERFYFDADKKAVVELKEGSDTVIYADQVIFAVGQRPEGTEKMGLELVHSSYIKTGSGQETSMDGVFAAGDVVTGTKSVIEAIAAGRKCAESMDIYLGGNGDICEELVEKEDPDPYIGRCPGFADITRQKPEMADIKDRSHSFIPVEHVFTKEEASCEAGRCLQCDLRLMLHQPKLWNEY